MGKHIFRYKHYLFLTCIIIATNQISTCSSYEQLADLFGNHVIEIDTSLNFTAGNGVINCINVLTSNVIFRKVISNQSHVFNSVQSHPYKHSGNIVLRIYSIVNVPYTSNPKEDLTYLVTDQIINKTDPKHLAILSAGRRHILIHVEAPTDQRKFWFSKFPFDTEVGRIHISIQRQTNLLQTPNNYNCMARTPSDNERKVWFTKNRKTYYFQPHVSTRSAEVGGRGCFEVNWSVKSSKFLDDSLGPNECIRYLIENSLNCSRDCLSELLIFAPASYATVFGKVDISLSLPLPFGSQSENLEYVTMLENTDEMIGLGWYRAYTGQFDGTTWSLFLAALFVAIGFFVIGFKSTHMAFWLIGEIFKNGSLPRKIFSSGLYLAMFFSCSMTILRNYYCSNMYSFLTITPIPVNVPENIFQVFEHDGTKFPGEALVDYTFAYRVRNRFRGNNITDITEIVQTVGKHSIGKVKYTRDLFSSFETFEKLILGKGLAECMSFERIYNLQLLGGPDNNEAYCDLSERITFVYTSMETAAQLAVPLISVFGTRQIIIPTQKTANHYGFLSTSWFWFTRKNYTGLDSIIRQMGLLSQNGLFICEEKLYKTKLIRKNLIEKNDRLMTPKKWNFWILAIQFVDGIYKQDEHTPNQSQQLNKLILILLICKIILVLSGFILLFEIFSRSRV